MSRFAAKRNPKQVLVVTYTVHDVFKIPKGIDLDNLKYWVKWNVLNIEFDDGKIMQIQAEGLTDNFDYKRPDTMEIDDSCNYLGDDTDDDDETDVEETEEDKEEEETA